MKFYIREGVISENFGRVTKEGPNLKHTAIYKFVVFKLWMSYFNENLPYLKV